MGSGQNSGPVNVYCRCHGNQRMAVITSGEGIEVVSRHHGTYHTGSLSVPELLQRLSGTVNGSAIVQFVREAIR